MPELVVVILTCVLGLCVYLPLFLAMDRIYQRQEREIKEYEKRRAQREEAAP